MTINIKEKFSYVCNFVLENGNGDELLSTEYINKEVKLEFICHKCGNLYSLDWDHFQSGRRCQQCGKTSIAEKQKNSIDYLKKYILDNGDGDYLVSDFYINERKPIKIFCHKHNGIYEISWSNFKSGRRCVICGDKNRRKQHSKTFSLKNGNLLEKYPEIAKDWDYEKNSDIPENYPTKSGHSVYWRCHKCGYNYSMVISYRTEGDWRCPSCKRIKGSWSKGNDRITEYLIKNNFLYKKEKRIKDCRDNKPLPFDFCVYIQDKFVLIEFQGRQHYEPVDFFNKSNEETRMIKFDKNKMHDDMKYYYCQKNNIKLIIIPYWDYDNIEQILEKELNLS